MPTTFKRPKTMSGTAGERAQNPAFYFRDSACQAVRSRQPCYMSVVYLTCSHGQTNCPIPSKSMMVDRRHVCLVIELKLDGI